MTNNALKSPNEINTDTTLLSSLLLDLFEKITFTKPRSSESWTTHVNGALALVKLRGLKQFQTPSEFHVLVRLINHYIASCVTNAEIVPLELLAVRDYVANNLNYEEHTLHVSELTVEFAKLRNGHRTGSLSNDEYVRASKGLDLKLEALDLTMPPAWRYSRSLVDDKSERMFDFHFDSYPHRNICYARNFIRVGRILLNEALIEGYLASPEGEKYWTLMERAYENIDTMASEICASLPQYSDCDGAARDRLPTSERSDLGHDVKELGHTHTLHHQAECYSLIWPLYAAGRSKAGPEVRPWVIKQLHYIGSHFCIRNAEIVAHILEGDEDVCTWDIYAVLGSYSFNA